MNIPNLIALGWSRTPIRNARTRTRRWIVVGLLGLIPFTAAPAETPSPVELVEGYPRSYTVGEDDTVWNIASQFLRRPWQWVEVWHAGEVLYPGDVLIVSEEAGQVQIKVLKVEKRAPRVRVTRRGRPIPTIMPEAVRPFLTGPLLVQPSETILGIERTSQTVPDQAIGQNIFEIRQTSAQTGPDRSGPVQSQAPQPSGCSFESA